MDIMSRHMLSYLPKTNPYSVPPRCFCGSLKCVAYGSFLLWHITKCNTVIASMCCNIYLTSARYTQVPCTLPYLAIGTSLWFFALCRGVCMSSLGLRGQYNTPKLCFLCCPTGPSMHCPGLCRLTGLVFAPDLVKACSLTQAEEFLHTAKLLAITQPCQYH